MSGLLPLSLARPVQLGKAQRWPHWQEINGLFPGGPGTGSLQSGLFPSLSSQALPGNPLQSREQMYCGKTQIWVKPKSFIVIIHRETSAQLPDKLVLDSVGQARTTMTRARVDSSLTRGQCSAGKSSCWQSWGLGPAQC